MTDLVVVSFNDKFMADEVLLTLLRLEHDYLIDLEDAVIVIKRSDGTIRIKPAFDLVAAEAVSDGDWGIILRSIMFHRHLEIASQVIDAQFLQEVEDALPPNSSAIFVLVTKVELEPVLTALDGFNGKVLHTSLPPATKEKLQAALAK
jgi:uncharacterized membrane protein